MTSAWGKSWAFSWGGAWGAVAQQIITGGGAGGPYLQFWLDKAKEAQKAVTQKNKVATQKAIKAIASAPAVAAFFPPKITEQKTQEIDFEGIYSDLNEFIARLEKEISIYSQWQQEENDEIALLLSIA